MHLDHSSPFRKQPLHYIKFPHKMRKLLLRLALSEPLALVNKFTFFDNPIELYVLLEGIIFLSVHDSINFYLFNLVEIEFCGV